MSRTEQKGRYGVAGLRPHVLPQGQSSMAGSQGCHQEAEVRQDQREEDVDAHRGTVQRIPLSVFVCFFKLCLLLLSLVFHRAGHLVLAYVIG